VALYDTASFAAGENAGTRVASCVARLAAQDLMEGARWWNRRRRGAMSSALIACANELERDADARATAEPTPASAAPGLAPALAAGGAGASTR